MRFSKQGISCRLLIAGAIGALAMAAPAQAQDAIKQSYNIEGKSLAEALRTVSRVSGREIMFVAESVRAKRAPKLIGSFTLDEAVSRLIAGTDLIADFRDDAVLIRGRSRSAGETNDRPTENTDILVTGSRIKGAPPTSPVTVLTAASMRLQGQNDLGEAIRSLPQNFAGGQNPGVAFSAGGGSQNLTGGSSLNLRGLGADASLTLLNGHRLAYDSAIQAIDISAIPLAAVDRVEIIADGASALYGSDAVAGVANIILKKDFDGLDTRARFGAATDGGFVQQQYSVVAGSRWASGGVLAAIDAQHSTEVAARDRSYTAAVPDTNTLYPGQDYTGIVVSGHQRLFSGVTVDVDGYYSRRTSPLAAGYVAAGYTQEGQLLDSKIEAFGVSPRLSFDFAHGWRAEVRATYGKEKDDIRTDVYTGGSLVARYPVAYENRLTVVEGFAEGGLAQLPGGSARLAVGGGFRTIGFRVVQQVLPVGGSGTTAVPVDTGLDSYFAYGELFVPIVGPAQKLHGVERLSLTAAARFEHYAGLDSVVTPKFGLIYSPFPGVDIKGSWGRSFKVPTLVQTTLAPTAVLSRASSYASGYPASAAVLYTDGGNPDLKPEHARTWTATVSLHPPQLGGARIEASYFNIAYRDRILSPLAAKAGALVNPLYQDIVTLAPTKSQIDALIARAPVGLNNQTSFPFAYANVIAIVDNRYRNIASYTAKGVDLSLSVPIGLRSAGDATFLAAISYLDSAQQLNPHGAAVERSGTIFYPPHWHARVGATWTAGNFELAPMITYIGDLADTRTAAVRRVGSMTTVDLTARYRVAIGALRGLDLSLSVLNIFNAKPATIVVPAFYYPPYDSANYSPIGRSVSVSIGKTW